MYLPGDEQTDFSGYIWFRNNRKQHVRTRKASGGVGVLVKNYLLEQFRINVTDRTMDGIIGVCLMHCELDFCLVVFLVIYHQRVHREDGTLLLSLATCWLK